MFDPFAVKVCERNSVKTVGHLPREISRITKFKIDRGAAVSVEIIWDHYNDTTTSKDIRTFFDKERDVIARTSGCERKQKNVIVLD